MAFAYTLDGSSVIGSMRKTFGTFTNGTTDTGGAISVGLSVVRDFNASPNSHVDTTVSKHTISNAASGGATVTIVTGPNVDGIWCAEGFGGG